MKITILIPIYNGISVIDALMHAIDQEKIANGWNLDVIFVEDGSTDNTFEKIVSLSESYPYIKCVKLSRNFGHQAALRVGLEYVQGDYIAIMDDDLQDHPRLLKKFFGYLDDGYDVVYGIRKKRKENLWKVASYSVFYRLLKKISDISIPQDSGDFCAMKKHVVDQILLLKERNPFIRGIRYWIGFRQIGVEYEREKGIADSSRYNLSRLIQLAADGIFSFSNIPIRIIFLFGCIGLSLAASYATFLLFKYFLYGSEVKGFTMIILINLFFGFLIVTCLGIIGEYISRLYAESKKRPYGIVEKVVNF